MAKHYLEPDPLHGNGKAIPKPYNPGNSPRRTRWFRGASPTATNHNSRVRSSKKEQIAERDWQLAQHIGWDKLSERRKFERVNRAMSS